MAWREKQYTHKAFRRKINKHEIMYTFLTRYPAHADEYITVSHRIEMMIIENRKAHRYPFLHENFNYHQ